MELFDLNYKSLSTDRSRELFELRKVTFKDRLNWAVVCQDEMEFDEYDGEHTDYIFGVKNGSVFCSVRLIDTRYNNMISGTFYKYFDDVSIPDGNYLESSRFFVDKKRSQDLFKPGLSVGSFLFLAMVNYSMSRGYEGIYTIVSHPMLKILNRSGWKINVVSQGLSEKNKNIYLVFLPTDSVNQDILIRRVNQDSCLFVDELRTWPLSINTSD